MLMIRPMKAVRHGLVGLGIGVMPVDFKLVKQGVKGKGMNKLDSYEWVMLLVLIVGAVLYLTRCSIPPDDECECIEYKEITPQCHNGIVRVCECEGEEVPVNCKAIDAYTACCMGEI